MAEPIIFLIESGKPLELVLNHLTEVRRVEEQSKAIARELGVERVSTSLMDGTVRAVEFTGVRPKDFNAPGKWGSKPKKGTPWGKRFAAQVGYENPSKVIEDAFKIPLDITNKNSGQMIVLPYTACGFLYLSDGGPFGMWIPDVEGAVAEWRTAHRGEPDEPARSFKPEFEGCKRLHMAEWKLLVAVSEVNALKQAAA